MENKVSALEEKNLTRAIEKAATVATVNDALDRNQLLADQLTASGVDKKFAKVASAAFNKRITVLTFQKTADEHRGEPFALTDDSVVYRLMGGDAMDKAASIADALGSFIMEFHSFMPEMQKSAAEIIDVTPVRLPYEETVDYKTFQNHIESMLDKHAAAQSYWTGVVESVESRVSENTQAVAKELMDKHASDFTLDALKNHYGESFEAAFKDVLPADTDFRKTAAYAILPQNDHFYNKVASVIEDRQTLDDLKCFISSYGSGLSEFCKTAADVGNYIAKAENAGLSKMAIGGVAGAALSAGSGNLLRGISMVGLTGIQGADAIRRATQDAAVSGFTNVRNMYNAGRSIGMNPVDVLDSDFLVNDRYRDRLMSWSDMSADPQFSMYPAEQVFQATNKAMDTDTSLERPDRRELLRAQVAQLLAQNNRQGTADVAAQATTLKDLSTSGGSAAELAAAPVAAMDKVDRPEPIAFENILAAEPEADKKDYITQYTMQMQHATEEAKKQIDKIKESEQHKKERAEDKEDDERKRDEALDAKRFEYERNKRDRDEEYKQRRQDAKDDYDKRRQDAKDDYDKRRQDAKNDKDEERQRRANEEQAKRKQTTGDRWVSFKQKQLADYIKKHHYEYDSQSGRWENTEDPNDAVYTSAQLDNALAGYDDARRRLNR